MPLSKQESENRIYRLDVSLFVTHLHHPHHSVSQVFRDVAVEHPVTGVAHIEQKIGSRAGRNLHGVFPYKIFIHFTVD